MNRRPAWTTIVPGNTAIKADISKHIEPQIIPKTLVRAVDSSVEFSSHELLVINLKNTQ